MFNIQISEGFHENHLLYVRGYYYNNMHHRQYGPAHLGWHDNGDQYWEAWYLNGDRHRTNGPAYRLWHVDGTVYGTCYWLYGIKITDLIKEWAIATGIKDIMMMTPEELTVFKLTWGHDVQL